MKLREVSNLDDEFCEGLERTEFCQRQKPPKNPAKHVALEKLVQIPWFFWGVGCFLGGISSPKKLVKKFLRLWDSGGPFKRKDAKWIILTQYMSKIGFMEGFIYIVFIGTRIFSAFRNISKHQKFIETQSVPSSWIIQFIGRGLLKTDPATLTNQNQNP